MPTPSERRALLFLSALLVLGGAVRASAALRAADATLAPASDPQSLANQIRAVDSARREKRVAPAKRPASGRVTSASAGRLAPSLAQPAPRPEKIDVDVASAADLQRLPRIGPVLARRIVADRDSLGPFGSLRELQRVRGVGPKLAAGIAPHVTFSLQPRPSRVVTRADRAPEEPGRRRSRRTGSPP